MNIRKKINRAFELCEKFFSLNWFNPFATLYLNLRCLPLGDALQFPVWVFGRPRLMNLCGRIEIKGQLRSGMVRFNRLQVGSPSNAGIQSELNVAGTIIFHGDANIQTGCRIVVDGGAVLEIGKGFSMMDCVIIGCAKSIKMGDYVRITHRSQIFDTNFHYIVNYNTGDIPPCSRPVEIGDHCWICNTSTVAPGAVIPSTTIVASNSLVNKDFSSIPPNSIIGGMPARLICSGYRRVLNIKKEREITRYYELHPDAMVKVPDCLDAAQWFEI